MANKKPMDYATPPNHERQLSKGCFVLLAAAALPLLLLGGAWLYTFIFTDFRLHHRPIMIPLALLALSLGAAMIALPLLLKRKR
jgi:hypothetical protein